MIATTAMDAILETLRETMASRGLNSAALAAELGEERKMVRRALSGQAPLSLALFLKVVDVLEIAVTELPWSVADLPPTPLEEKTPQEFELDPFGIQGEQAFRLGFALGVDFLFVAEASQLTDSGIPSSVLEQWPEEIVLKLDAAYHRHNAPQFSEEGVALNLSFDMVYSCFLPWSSIQKVVFNLEAPEPNTEPEPEAKPRGPGLRLVKG